MELSNLGPLRSAQMELGDLNLLIGENNTGKTFFATVLHRVLDAKPEPQYRLTGRPTEVPDEVQEWITRLLMARTATQRCPRSSLAHQATIRWSGQQVSLQTSWNATRPTYETASSTRSEHKPQTYGSEHQTAMRTTATFVYVLHNVIGR